MYAIVSPDNTVAGYQDSPAVTAKGWRCLPVTDIRPAPTPGQILQGPEIALGDVAVTRTWIAVSAPPPSEVSMRQARLALLDAGLLDTVEAWAGQTGGTVKVTWEYAATIRRDDPMIEQAAGALALTIGQLDELFRKAATL